MRGHLVCLLEGTRIIFPQQQNFAMGPLKPRLAPMRSGAASTPGSGQGSGGFWCKYLPEGSGEAPEGSVRLQRAPVQIPCEVLEGSGADTLWGSRSFRCSVRFRRVTVQIACTMTKQVILILCDFIWFCSSNMRNESLIFDSRAFWYATWPNRDACMAWNMRLDLNHDQRGDKRPWKPVKNGWLKNCRHIYSGSTGHFYGGKNPWSPVNVFPTKTTPLANPAEWNTRTDLRARNAMDHNLDFSKHPWKHDSEPS